MTEVITSVKPDSRRTWTRRALLWVLLLACGGAAYWIGSQSVSSSLANGGLTIAEASLDFGAVWEDGEFAWKLPVRNANSTEIDVRDFTSSCTCLGIEPRSFNLAPGETRELKLRLDLRPRTREKASAWQWRFEAGIVPQIANEPIQQVGWTVRGHVRKLLDAPRIISFGDKLVRGGEFRVKKVRVVAAVHLHDLRADSEKSTISVTVVRLGPREFELAIQPQPSLPTGSLRTNIALYAFKEDKDKRLAKILTVQGVIHDEVECLPSPLLLGAVTRATTATGTITLLSRLGRRLEVEKWEAASESTSVERIAGSKRAWSFRVVQNMAVIGDARSEVTFVVRTRGRTLPVTLPILYHGVENRP